jgi:hypothetical protein
VNQYREGKVKSTPARGVKEYLKPCAYKQWEGYAPPFRTPCPKTEETTLERAGNA